MKTLRNKSKAATIILILMLTIITLVTFLPTVNARNVPTYAFVTVSPNPVGVNQQVSIIMWLDKIEPTAEGPGGGRWGDYTVAVTKPNEDTETLGPFTADDTSYAFTLYTPDQVGTYTLEFNFPGKQVTGFSPLLMIPINDYYEPSNFTTTLTVQAEPVESMPQTPLPTDFWRRPIDAQNQEWYTISGNWLAIGPTTFGDTSYNYSGNFNPFTRAPRSAHIVWTKPLTFGGLIGGEFGGTSESNYYTGKSYEPKFTPPIIINGVLYYNEPLPPKNGYYAVDLRTGETLWHHESYGPLTEVGAVGLLGTPSYPGLTNGQIFSYRSPNEVGARAYLWFAGSAGPAGAGFGASPFWYMYDAETGDLILEMDNATGGGVRVEGPKGELLYYYLGTNWLALWNSTRAIGTLGTTGTQAWAWRPPTGSKIDWRDGIQWNVTLPIPIPFQATSLVGSGILLATTGTFFAPFDWQMEVAYDMETGAQLWIQNRTTPVGASSFGLMGILKDGVYTEFDKGATQWRGYDASTGEEIWGPTTPYTNAWGSQPLGIQSAYGIQYQKAVDGIHALNYSNGQRLWDYYADPSGSEFPGFATLPFLGGDLTIADEIIFAPTGNSHGDPIFRGAKLYAIDAMSGEQVWSINGFFLGTMPIADGYLVGQNGYDNQIYCFGKGQTATTVDAEPAIIAKGTNVLIKGTVTDQSSGAADTPAISDADMSAWMEYLYQQQSMPQNVEGVEVTLDAIDPNNNFIHIGRVTSDMNGFYSYMWEPEHEGTYKIISTFEGTNSYYSSYAETAVGVGPAPSAGQPMETEEPTTAPPPTTEEPSTAPPTTEEPTAVPTEAPVITTEVLIIAAVGVAAIIGVGAYWVLRRRK